ncbi:MAG TPA: carboxypeptidase-like regulatory domain-containing protein, partial [Bryobacteraceae bacterium]|nr:carboxypeptidase-like regulatory domain-containing protein [Bryobacteraceae bacterium]
MSRTAVEVQARCRRAGMLLALAAALLGTAPALWSQEMRGTIAGRITDQSGASIPGAQVTITNQATNVVTEVVTNVEGNYVAPFLPPGVYSIRVQREGFQSMTRSEITLQTQGRLTVDFTLAPGSVT